MNAPGQQPFDALLAEVASVDSSLAAGFIAATCCAQAAALLELTATLAAARLTDGEPLRLIAAEALVLRSEALAAAQLEGSAYSDAVASGKLSAAADPPLAIAQTAAKVGKGAAQVVGAGDWPFTPDAVAAAVLADCAATVACSLVAANLAAAPDDPRLREARAARGEAAAARTDAETGGA